RPTGDRSLTLFPFALKARQALRGPCHDAPHPRGDRPPDRPCRSGARTRAHNQNYENRLTLFPGAMLPTGERPKPVGRDRRWSRGRKERKRNPMGYRVAVIGATGNVGREMLAVLAERKFPISELIPLASSRSVGQELSFGDKRVKAKALDTFDFTGVDFALMSAGSSVSKDWSPKIAAQGTVVIDNSSFWRYHQDVPLVVPEVNGHVLESFM